MHNTVHYAVMYGIETDERRTEFEKKIKATYPWWHFTPSAMIICTSQSPAELQSTLIGMINEETDRILAVQLQQYGIRAGWVDPEATAWLNEHLGASRWFT